MGEEGVVSIPDHQVGVVWPAGRTDNLILSLNLAGDLNYLTEGSPKPHRVVHGHQKNITAIDVAFGETPTLWTGSSDGDICCWDPYSGTASTIDGSPHTNYISSISASPSTPPTIYSVGWDDTLRTASPTAKTFTGTSTKTDGQPKIVVALSSHAIVATHKGIEIFHSGSKIYTLPTTFSPTALAANPDILAIAGDDSTLRIYTLSLNGSSPSLSLKHTIPDISPTITTLALLPNQYLAAGFSNGKILVYSLADWSVAITRWSAHTARVNAIRWHESGRYAASGSLDGAVFVWSVKKPGMRVSVGNAHRDGVNGVGWVSEDVLVSVGGDGCVKRWRVGGLDFKS